MRRNKNLDFQFSLIQPFLSIYFQSYSHFRFPTNTLSLDPCERVGGVEDVEMVGEVFQVDKDVGCGQWRCGGERWHPPLVEEAGKLLQVHQLLWGQKAKDMGHAHRSSDILLL